MTVHYQAPADFSFSVQAYFAIDKYFWIHFQRTCASFGDAVMWLLFFFFFFFSFPESTCLRI